MESVGYFFTCKIIEILPIKNEDNLEITWVNPEDAIKLLYLDNQKEALVQYIKIINKHEKSLPSRTIK